MALDYDINKLERILGAEAVLKQMGEKGAPLATKVLEKVANDFGYSLGLRGLIKTVTDPKIIGTAVKNMSSTYYEDTATETVQDILTRYDNDIGEYLGDEYAGFTRTYLSQFSDRIYGDINKELSNAQNALDSINKGLNVEGYTKESCEETFKRYQFLNAVIESIRNERIEGYVSDARNEYTKEQLRNLAKETYEQQQAQNSQA